MSFLMLSTVALGAFAFLFLSSSVPEVTLPGAAAAETAETEETGEEAAAESATPTPSRTPTPTPTRTATPTPEPEEYVEVGGTGGRGVYMRSKPSASAQPVASFEERTKFKVIGEDVAADGYVWRNVEDERGRKGWVVANFLVKSSPPAESR